MEHLDAKAIRERLHAINLAISNLEALGRTPHDEQVAAQAHQALRDIVQLVNCDESEQHGVPLSERDQVYRERIRAGEPVLTPQQDKHVA